MLEQQASQILPRSLSSAQGGEGQHEIEPRQLPCPGSSSRSLDLDDVSRAAPSPSCVSLDIKQHQQ